VLPSRTQTLRIPALLRIVPLLLAALRVAASPCVGWRLTGNGKVGQRLYSHVNARLRRLGQQSIASAITTLRAITSTGNLSLRCVSHTLLHFYASIECAMADRRSVRSASRRKTPTPQPPSKANTPQPARASRTRALRSASRDVEIVETLKPTRRSAQQASITTVTDESEHERHTTRKSRRRPAKEAMGG
jgi:hypothetical protein